MKFYVLKSIVDSEETLEFMYSYIKDVTDVCNGIWFLAGVGTVIIAFCIYQLIDLCVLTSKMKKSLRNLKGERSEYEVITYDEFNERQQKKGEPDDK